MSEWPWVNTAYALTWITFGVYALSLRRRRGRLEQQAADITGRKQS